jgi:predicted nucleic acid-binding protein
LGIKSFHSTFLIFLAVKRGILSKEEAKNIVDYMIDSGWRCDVETYRNILRVLQRL